jgi:PAS domain S-box-containing protein
VKGWYFKALGGLASLVFLGWLYQQSSQIDLGLHVRTVAHFEQLRQQDARLNQYVLQARYNLLHNYDPIVATQQSINELLDALAQNKPDYFSLGTSPIQQEFARYRASFATKFEQVEAFKSHNAVLRNSMRYFPLATQQLMAMAGGSLQRNERLHDLLESVLLFDNEPSNEQRRHVEEVMAQLTQMTSQNREALASLAKHVGVILEYQPEVNKYTRNITQSESSAEGNKLFALYAQDYTERQHRANRFRLALAMLAGSMLAYVAWMVVALQRTRRSLQGSLRELEFQKFALDAHSIVSVADRSGKILDINDKFTEISQYSREELIGQDHRVLNSGYHPHDFFKTMWATIGHGQVWHDEVKNRRKDGTFYWVDSTIVPFMDDNGKVLRYVSIRTDITKRKAADELLTLQGRFYERISETLGEGIYVQDVDGLCIYMNTEAERLLGWSRDEFLGRPVHDTIHTETADGAKLHGRDCAIMQAIQHTGSAMLEDQVFVRKNGTVFPVALASRASTNTQGKMEAVVVAFSDITERKQTELAMRQAKDAAEQAVRVKGDFLANMSHEIRTPMNGIIGMTNLALDTELNSEQREYIGMVKTSADALLTIINDILDFSKIESGKMTVEVLEFSLEAMLRDTIKALAVRAHQKGLELLLHVASSVPDRVQGDPGRIRQVLVNLVGNAIKFTEHGEIELAVTRLADAPEAHARLSFSVRDTGIGIPADKFDAIFDSFSQADTSTTRKYGGTGLGLTISAQLVALMGGQIQLQSTVGKGSTFYFTLDMPVTSDNALAHYQTTGRIKDLPVLVVDDNLTNRRLLCEMLGNWHMRPTAVADGPAALAELARAAATGTPYALAVLDVQMPGMDGFELAAHMRSQLNPHTATVMMLTSQGQRGDGERCRQLGVSSYLSKPVSQSDLLDALMTALGDPLPTRAPLITRHSLRETRRKLNLLLAEDNLVNQKLATVLLGQQGHSVTLANNGREALALWQDHTFDAILMDVDMPEMNGYEATERIRAAELASGMHIPIIAMTAHAMQDAREECLSHGMDGYLSKPINVDALWLELDRLMPSSTGKATTPSQTARMPDDTLTVADFTQLRQNLDHNHELFKELIALYETDVPLQRSRLQEGLAQNDADSVRRAAHAIKGMVGVFAAERSMTAAQAVEDHADQPDCASMVLKLNQALDEFSATLKAHVW